MIKGWDKNKDLSEVLKLNKDKDVLKRYTQYGPHRADIKITFKGKPADEMLSRGQQKLLVISLYLAHIHCLTELGDKRAIILIDDITAELDASNFEIIFGLLKRTNTQIICTVLDELTVDKLAKSIETKFNMFHVEHGNITAIK